VHYQKIAGLKFSRRWVYAKCRPGLKSQSQQ